MPSGSASFLAGLFLVIFFGTYFSMRVFPQIFVAVSLLISCFCHADALTSNTTGQFKKIDLDTFIAQNHVSKKMADKKQRAMLPPTAVQFTAKLMQAPKPGKFSLVYDALSLWPSDEPLPHIDHSAFLKADNGRVISTYVSKVAAEQLKSLYIDTPVDTHIYAIHIYNYAKGPRLVVIGAAAVAE